MLCMFSFKILENIGKYLVPYIYEERHLGKQDIEHSTNLYTHSPFPHPALKEYSAYVFGLQVLQLSLTYLLISCVSIPGLLYFVSSFRLNLFLI
jgi:hypothetical protein